MYETFNCPPVHQEETTAETQVSSHVAFYVCKNYVSKADLLCFQQKVCTKIILEVFRICMENVALRQYNIMSTKGIH